MLTTLKKYIHKLINACGYRIIPLLDPMLDHDELFLDIYKKSRIYTMTSKERMYALYKSVRYVIDANVPGDFVECGAWRGGSMMLVAHTLLALDKTDRKIFLYDTFAGMTEPCVHDHKVSNSSDHASKKWQKNQAAGHNTWCYAPLDEVKNNMFSTAYPENNMIFIKGKIEDTIPQNMPSEIALLRLDTDWYQSTKHELTHLFPLLTKNGALIIDDYGHWAGSKKAVDEYFANIPILLHRIDRSGRIGIKI